MPHRGLYSPWNSPGQNAGVGSLSLLQIFPTQGSNPGLPHCRQWILSSVGKESACNAGDPGLIPGSGRSGEGKGYPLQYSGLENSMDSMDFVSMGLQRGGYD